MLKQMKQLLIVMIIADDRRYLCVYYILKQYRIFYLIFNQQQTKNQLKINLLLNKAFMTPLWKQKKDYNPIR